MSALKELAKHNPKLSPIISTVICVGICWERAHSFAQAQQTAAPEAAPTATPEAGITEKIDLPLPGVNRQSKQQEAPQVRSKPKSADLLQTVPLELRAVQKFENIRTRQQACVALEGKIVTFYDSAALVTKCIQRPIEDADFLNELIFKKRTPVAEVPARVYRLIPFGEPWVKSQNNNVTVSKVCRDLNGKYVTSTGTDYFFIEACKKRSFGNYVEMQAHNKRNAPILTVAPDVIEKIPDGRPLDGNYEREVGALYRIVGDSSLSPLSTDNQRSKPVSSAEELAALPQKSGKGSDSKNICRELNQKVVSFYSQIFFITNCQKRPIKDLPIAVQQRFAERGTSIVDVSSKQIDAIPTGKELSEEEALALIK